MLKSDRLILRRLQEKDLEDFELLIRDKMSSKYAPYDVQWSVDNLKDIIAFLISDDVWYAVELTAKDKVIGFVVASPGEDESIRDLGYTIHSAYQNKGYAYEACRALMDFYMKENGIRKFTSGTADCNEPSVKLLKKLGFSKVRSLEASFCNDAQGNPIRFPASAYERVYTK